MESNEQAAPPTTDPSDAPEDAPQPEAPAGDEQAADDAVAPSDES